MKRIFISYARSDQAFARQLANKLEAIGADVWIDLDDIIAGEKWSSAIQDGLDSSDGMVVVLSPDSMASNNVEDEWQYFMDNSNPVIPILLKPAKVHFQLNRLQYVDFHTQAFDPAFKDLLEELRSKGVALGGSESNVTVPHPSTPASASTYAEQAQATTLTKPLWQQPPIIVGASVLLIALIALIWFIVPDNADDFAFIEEILIIEDDSWAVHEDANSTAQLITFGESDIIQRLISNGEIWYSVVDVDMDFVGFQVAENIPVDNYNVLNVIPIEVTILGESITLFDRPYSSDNSMQADIVGISYLYGNYEDPDGNIWHYITVFESDNGEKGFTGWARTDDRLLVDDDYTILPLIYSSDNIRVDGGTIRENDLLWLISVDIDSTLYEVAYYDTDLDQWRVVFVDSDDLDIDTTTNSNVPYRGN